MTTAFIFFILGLVSGWGLGFSTRVPTPVHPPLTDVPEETMVAFEREMAAMYTHEPFLKVLH